MTRAGARAIVAAGDRAGVRHRARGAEGDRGSAGWPVPLRSWSAVSAPSPWRRRARRCAGAGSVAFAALLAAPATWAAEHSATPRARPFRWGVPRARPWADPAARAEPIASLGRPRRGGSPGPSRRCRARIAVRRRRRSPVALAAGWRRRFRSALAVGAFGGGPGGPVTPRRLTAAVEYTRLTVAARSGSPARAVPRGNRVRKTRTSRGLVASPVARARLRVAGSRTR